MSFWLSFVPFLCAFAWLLLVITLLAKPFG